MTILHARTDPDMLTRLKQMLGSASRADIAVGYFFVSGFAAVADEISRLGKVRILVGRTDRQTVEAVALGVQRHEALGARLRADATVQRSLRDSISQTAVNNIAESVSALPQSDDAQQTVAKLRDLINAGFLEMRSYPRGLLHAKAYLCWYDSHAEPGAAIVGSSNFTLAGFSGNTELNVRVTGDAEMAELSRWFEELWADSADIGEALVSELDRSWAIARTPPYHVYLKALYELYGDKLSDGEDLPLPAGVSDLANFQIDAVKWGLNTIERYGGCYIGDVVGLGKTYIGAELLRQLKQSYPNEGNPLIICPAGLVPMWRDVNERYQLGAEVVSQSVIAPPPDTEFDEELGRYIDGDADTRGVVLADRYPNRGAVLVDEAHNFRNINRRSEGLRHYLDGGDHKVVLMSATPQNLGPRDIYRQLRLFLDETNHGLNIEPVELEDYFRSAENWHEYKTEQEEYRAQISRWRDGGRQAGEAEPQPPKTPTTPHASVENVLSPVFIRRRRRDLREIYGDTATINGEPVRFPTPTLDNLEYRLDRVYAKAGPFSELQALLQEHLTARYRAADYLTEQAKDKAQYRDLLRAKGRTAGLIRALLLKRLESSIEAFRSTLDTLINSNRNFRDALAAGYVPIGDTATRMLAGSGFDADELLDVLRQEETARQQIGHRRASLVHSAADFKADEWLDDLDKDFETLGEIKRRIKDIGPADDDKLHSLRRFLERPEVRRGKALIFSESETTINYLFEQLNPDGKHSDIARLSGSVGREGAANIVRRFSPRSNMASAGHDEVRILLATDVVSEGQNLQDCARVLNYDLHWNPVRLIQRFGRVDRIGSTHTDIYLHNMWPDLKVDEELELTDRLTNRIQMFHDLIGLDNYLLSNTEQVNDSNMYRIYEDKALPDLDDEFEDIGIGQRAQALLQRIRQDDPELWQKMIALPDGIRSALKVQAQASAHTTSANIKDRPDTDFVQAPLPVDGAQIPMPAVDAAAIGADSSISPLDPPTAGETLVLLAAGEFKGYYAVGSNLHAREITQAQFIAATECTADTPIEPLPQDTNQRVMAAFKEFSETSARRLGSMRRPSRIRTSNGRYLSRQLNRILDEGGDAQSVSILKSVFIRDLPSAVNGQITEMRRTQITGSALLIRLHALRERYRLNPPQQSETPTAAVPPVVRIVCSDGLIG